MHWELLEFDIKVKVFFHSLFLATVKRNPLIISGVLIKDPMVVMDNLIYMILIKLCVSLLAYILAYSITPAESAAVEVF